MNAVYVEKGITLRQNQFEELKRRGNDVSGLVVLRGLMPKATEATMVIAKVMINLRKVTWWL